MFPSHFQDLPESPASAKDPAAGEWGLRKEVFYSHLPWHPTMTSFLEATAKDISSTRSSAGKERGPLMVGEFTRPHRSFPSKFLAPRGASASVSVAPVNSSLGELSTSKIREPASLQKNQRQLEFEERLSKEMCAVQSAVTWLHSLQESLISLLDNPAHDVEATSLLKDVQGHLKLLDKLQSDFLSCLCGNSVLARRNAWIRAVAGPVPKELISKMRSSPILHDLLFDFTKEDITTHQETRERRSLISSLRREVASAA